MLLRKKTHIICCIFLFLLAIPQVLLVAIQLWQWHIRYEAIERLEKESLETITVDAKAIIWENQREVNIEGKMFDIKSFRVENEKYILTGIFDERETALKDLLRKQAPAPDHSFIILLILAQSFVIALFLICFPYLPSFIKHVSLFKNNYSVYCMELPTPPPKPLFVFS